MHSDPLARRRGAVALVIAVCLAWAANVRAAYILEGPVVNPANGHSYYLLSADTWTNSEAEAETLGGHLASISDQAENDFVYNTFVGDGTRNFWIGMYDPTQDAGGGHAANFVWVDGDAVGYVNWATPEEPNNYHAQGEYYVQMWANATEIAANPSQRQSGAWNDTANAGVYLSDGVYDSAFGVVEVVPEPAMLALVGLGTAAVLRRRHVRKP
jgi:hypothetical protein